MGWGTYIEICHIWSVSKQNFFQFLMDCSESTHDKHHEEVPGISFTMLGLQSAKVCAIGHNWFKKYLSHNNCT